MADGHVGRQRLGDLGVDSVSELMALASEDASGNAFIVFATGDKVIFEGVSKADLANVTLVDVPQINEVSVATEGGDAASTDGEANVIEGGSGDDIIIGSDGDDVILPGGGVDSIDGGAGEDTLSFDGASDGVRADLFCIPIGNIGP